VEHAAWQRAVIGYRHCRRGESARPSGRWNVCNRRLAHARTTAGFDEMVATDRLADAAARADYLINMLPASAENIDIF